MCSIFYYQHFVKTFKNYHKIESKDVGEFAKRVQQERLQGAVSICECEGQGFDWDKLNSFTKDELYEYYLDHFCPPMDICDEI